MKQYILSLLSFRAVFSIVLIALLYISLTAFIVNSRFLIQTMTGPFPLLYKTTIASELFTGIFSAFGPLSGVLLSATALLVGVNLTLLQKTVVALRRKGRVRMSVGGLTVMGLAASGCSSCGVSLISVFGVGSAFSGLPFFALQVQIATLVLLAVSAVHMLRQFNKAAVCAR